MAADNVIEVILQSQDAMSRDLSVVEQRLRGIEGASAGVGQGTALVTRRMDSLHRQLIPVHQAVGTVTNAVARLHPEFGVLISASDNLIFSMVRATSGATSLSGALAASLRVAFNPVTLGVLALVTAVGYLTQSWLKSKEAKEQFDKAMLTGAPNLVQSAIENLRMQIDIVDKQMLDLVAKAPARRAMPSGQTPASETARETARQGQLTALAAERAKLDELITKLTERRADAMSVELQTLFTQTQLERDLLGLQNKEARDRLTIQAEIDTLRAKGFKDEDLKLLQSERLATAQKKREQEFADLQTKNREEFMRGWEEDLTENFPQIYQQAMELVRKFDEETARRRAALLKSIGLEQLVPEALLDDTEKIRRMAGDLKDSPEFDIGFQWSDKIAQETDAAVATATAEMREKARREAEGLAEDFLGGIESVVRRGKEGLLDVFEDLGRSIAKRLLTQLIEGMNIPGMGGGGLDIFSLLLGGIGRPEGAFGPLTEGGGFFSNIFGGIGSLFGFKRGGMVVPRGAMRKFQHGGMVRNGPVMGVVGEEGPELVARMKPARPGVDDGKPLVQNIYLVDQRPPRLGPNDVVLIVSDNMQHGGAAAKAVKAVVKQVQ